MRILLPASSASKAPGRFATRASWAGIASVGLATVGLLLAGGNPALALVPTVLIAVVALLVNVPLRWTACGLVFAALALDETVESAGHWQSPLALVGDLTLYRIDSVLPIPGLALSGMEILSIAILGIRSYRRSVGSGIDESGRIAPPRVLWELAALYLFGVFLADAIGLARGWGVAAWKVRNLVHPLLLAGAFAAAFRSPRDAVPIGRIIVAAACIKGVMAHVVQRIARAETGGMFNSGVSHGDSIVFSMGAFLLVMGFLESPTRKSAWRLLLLAPILLGCVENDRRVVWVMIAMSFLLAYSLRPLAGWQRLATKAIVLGVPALLLYVAVGWNANNRAFAPIRTLRSVADTSNDTSTYWREVEGWNIMTSTRENSLLGMGLGGEYTEHMFNDDISSIYKEYKEWPHNTILGLLMLMGLFGFTFHWFVFPSVMFFSVRSYWRAGSAEERMVALGCVASAIACLVMAWGDTGAHYIHFKVLLGLALAFATKLAVATGAWPRSQRAN